MDTEYVHEFIELVQSKSYITAADNLFISQPTLSRHIKKLEEDLGFILIDRNSRKFRLTNAGEMFIPYAQQIEELQNEYVKMMNTIEKQIAPIVRIGTIPMMVPYKLTDLFMDFREKNPDINLAITEMKYQDMIRSLKENECDIVIAREEGDILENNFKRIVIGKDQLAAILPRNHALAGRKTVHLYELKEEKLLLPVKDSNLYNLCISSCRKAGFEPKVSFTSRGTSTAIELTSKNKGVALLMRRPVEEMEQREQIAVVPIEPEITATISVLYKSETLQNPYARKFLSLLSKYRLQTSK